MTATPRPTVSKAQHEERYHLLCAASAEWERGIRYALSFVPPAAPPDALQSLEAIVRGRDRHHPDYVSPYLCDVLTHYGAGHWPAIEALRDEIAQLIDQAYGVPDYLGLGSTQAFNWHPDVIAERRGLFAHLLNRYAPTTGEGEDHAARSPAP